MGFFKSEAEIAGAVVQGHLAHKMSLTGQSPHHPELAEKKIPPEEADEWAYEGSATNAGSQHAWDIWIHRESGQLRGFSPGRPDGIFWSDPAANEGFRPLLRDLLKRKGSFEERFAGFSDRLPRVEQFAFRQWWRRFRPGAFEELREAVEIFIAQNGEDGIE